MHIRKMLRWSLLALATVTAQIQCSEGHATPPPLSEGGSETPQQPENPAPSTEGYPAGVTVEEFSQTFSNGSKCLGFQVVADFKANPRLRFVPKCGYGTSQVLKPSAYFSRCAAEGKVKPCVAINGGFFGGSTSVSLLIEDGVVKSLAVQDDYIWSVTPYQHFFPVRAAFGQMASGEFETAWVYCVADDGNKPYAFQSPLGNDEKNKVFMTSPPTSKTPGGHYWKAVQAIGAGPMLVYEGKNVAELNYWREIFDCGGLAGLSRQPRTAIGVTADGKLVMVVCDGRNKRGSAGYTLPELADKMIALGCTTAINLDGGGSSTFVGREGKVLNVPSDSKVSGDEVTIQERSIPTAVILGEANE